jgi:Leucine-rich repeat (LRR) protein
MRFNLINKIPAEIGMLENLQKLDLSNNLLTDITNELINLKQLKQLILTSNNLSDVIYGEVIKELPQLIIFLKKRKQDADKLAKG